MVCSPSHSEKLRWKHGIPTYSIYEILSTRLIAIGNFPDSFIENTCLLPATKEERRQKTVSPRQDKVDRIDKARQACFAAELIDSSLPRLVGAESLINENSTPAASLLREKINLLVHLKRERLPEYQNRIILLYKGL
jgi:crotonobetainyl-CoA:carnitine CoA-transferase CaiB-like acyl-CoA transferase